MNGDDLRQWVRLFAPPSARVPMLDALDDLEHGRDALLVRAYRALDYGEPRDRHPYQVVKHEAAKVLSGELRAMIASGEVRP